jgi:hypothetical protein
MASSIQATGYQARSGVETRPQRRLLWMSPKLTGRPQTGRYDVVVVRDRPTVWGAAKTTVARWISVHEGPGLATSRGAGQATQTEVLG